MKYSYQENKQTNESNQAFKSNHWVKQETFKMIPQGHNQPKDKMWEII